MNIQEIFSYGLARDKQIARFIGGFWIAFSLFYAIAFGLWLNFFWVVLTFSIVCLLGSLFEVEHDWPKGEYITLSVRRTKRALIMTLLILNIFGYQVAPSFGYFGVVKDLSGHPTYLVDTQRDYFMKVPGLLDTITWFPHCIYVWDQSGRSSSGCIYKYFIFEHEFNGLKFQIHLRGQYLPDKESFLRSSDDPTDMKKYSQEFYDLTKTRLDKVMAIAKDHVNDWPWPKLEEQLKTTLVHSRNDWFFFDTKVKVEVVVLSDNK